MELEGKKLTQRDSFVYLGGAQCAETGRRIERGTSKSTGRSKRVVAVEG